MKVLRTASVQWSLIALTVMFAIDRLHKFLQVDLAGWRGGESVRVAPFLDYVMVWNPGISYGLLDWVPPEALLVVMAVAIAALIWWWRTSTAFWVRLGIALILGGALSNVVDRLVYGAVADFFHFYVGNFSWFVFNLADVAISLGVATLAIDALWREVKPGAEGPETPQGTE